jgi:alkanesulfonate monooxygenase SsuD/methylene tetrahydromethanopterin reductase-like flavin-dependent oxidoreductase (luciferase family)
VRAAREVLAAARADTGRAGSHLLVVYVPASFDAEGRERALLEAGEWGLDLQPDALLAGGPAEVAAGVRRLAAAGADTVVLQPAGNEPDPEGFVRWAAEQVQPLLA